MSYVDLNPIRAGIAETPEASEFTSIRQRLQQWQSETSDIGALAVEPRLKVGLMSLVKAAQDPRPNALGLELREYLELVDWAGRAIREGKRGHIPQHTAAILQRLGLAPSGYLN